MDITFEEGKLLALYQEFYNEEYNANNEELTIDGAVLRYDRMQTVGYLLERLGIKTYGYTHYLGKPFSNIVEITTRSIDEKEDVIPEFYANSMENQNNDSDSDYLSKYFSGDEIERIRIAKTSLSMFFSNDEGRAMLSELLYISQRGNFLSAETVFLELRTMGYNPSIDLISSTWDFFGEIGIRNPADGMQRNRKPIISNK